MLVATGAVTTDTEMDKTRDVRREVSRFLRSRQIKQSIRPNNTKKFFSGLDGFGDFVTLVKSKKGRVRKLSVVGRASSSHEEMGCEVSDRDDFGSQSPPTSVCTSKKFKVPMKFFNDCNGVDHASVPRKLRSAMKKRGRESISPPLLDSKKLNHTNGGVEHCRKDDPKKPKLNVVSVSGPITKDEEEVAETLFALAGMFPDGEAIPLALPDAKGSLTAAFEGSMVSKEFNSICPSSKAVTNMEPSIKAEELSEQTVKMNSLDNPSVQGLPELPDSKQYKLETYSLIPPMNHQTFPFSSKNDEKTSCNSLHFGFASELNLDRGFEQPGKLETSLPEQHSIKDGKKNGLALWPGLSSTASGPILQSSTSKIPAWLETAPSSSCHKVTGHKKSLKRCAAHVYISRLINALQRPDRADRPPQPDHLKSSEVPKQETVASSSFDGIRKGAKGVVSSTTNIGNLHQDQRHAANVCGTYSSHAQSLDFFSLSSNNGTQRCHKGLEPMSRFHVPSLNPSLHNHSQLPQTSYSSSTHQVQLQQHHYMNPTHQQLQQSYQQQHHFWAAQYRPAAAEASMSSTLLENWQNGRQVIQSTQATSIPSLSQQQQYQHQQRLMAISSSSGGGLRPVGGMPLHLQLL